MGTGKPETTMAAGQGAPIGLSAPFVRVFSLSTAADLGDELRTLGGAGGTSPVQNLLQVAVKLLVPSAWRATVAHVVAAFPGLTLYTQPRGTDEDALLVIGLMPEIQACAGALSSAERAMVAAGAGAARPTRTHLSQNLSYLHVWRKGAGFLGENGNYGDSQRHP